jgi:hypothetical protein
VHASGKEINHIRPFVYRLHMDLSRLATALT